jgi:hypothetical protein
MIHLPVCGGLPKHKSERREYFSEHGLTPSVEYIDHLNATFMPATKALGDPA